MVAITLQPIHEIEALDDSTEGATWAMTGPDPQFLLAGLSGVLPVGVYQLRIEFPGGWDILFQPRLYFDAGEGFNETNSAPLSFSGRKPHAIAYFRLRRPARTLRFDPSMAPGKISTRRAEIRRASATAWRTKGARWRLSNRVRSSDDLMPEAMRALKRYRSAGLRGVLESLDYAAENERRSADLFHRMPLHLFLDRCEALAAKARAQADWTSPVLPGAETSLTLVVPVFRARPGWLKALLRSLERQTCAAFETILVFDGPQPRLERLARRRGRRLSGFRTLTSATRRGVSSACNLALGEARTEYAVVLDHDDLVPNYLVEFFHRAASAREPDVVTFDEALFDDERGALETITARGAFDLRHYLSHPYIVHPIFVRTALARQVEGFEPSLRVSHDVDFFLRCIARARSVMHVPIVGYLWRQHRGSLGVEAQPEVLDNTKKAIGRFVRDFYAWPRFEVEDGPSFNMFEVAPPLPTQARVAVVIPTKNRSSILRACLDSLAARRGANITPHDIYVVDHESDEPETLALLAERLEAGDIRIVRHQGPWNFSAINNAAVAEIRRRESYSHICFMNNDIELRTADWLDRMLTRFSYPDVGIVGCCLLYPDRRVQHAGVVVGLLGAAEHAFKFHASEDAEGARLPGYMGSLVATRDYGAVTAALMLVSSEVFSALDGFDEALAVGFNDTDLCLRAGGLGWKSCYVGSVVATHHESATRGLSETDPHPDDSALFRSRHLARISAGDEHYGRVLDWGSTHLRFTFQNAKPFLLRFSVRQGRAYTLAETDRGSVSSASK